MAAAEDEEDDEEDDFEDPDSYAQVKSLESIEGDSYGAHEVLPDALNEDRKQKIQSVAGPDVTDQIGRAVHNGAMEGGEPNPLDKRDLVSPGYNPSFLPDYDNTDTKSTGDLAKEELKQKSKALSEKLAAD
jgi:hypothetical protein